MLDLLFLQRMNLKQLLQFFTNELSNIYDRDEISSVFYLVTEHLTGMRRSQAIMAHNDLLSADAHKGYIKILERLKAGEPLQYVLGEASFFELTFRVNKNVLIPRPETEELVDWVIRSCNTRKGLQILDIGTGSGCIAVSLKKFIPEAVVTALDISEEALEVAGNNALLNEVDVHFVQADILTFSTADKYDIIVSNPPYIGGSEKAEMHANVLDFEPHLALFVADERPLLFYEAIADFAKVSLRIGGLLFFEINARYGIETVQMLSSKGFTNIELKQDMQGNDRMIRANFLDGTA